MSVPALMQDCKTFLQVSSGVFRVRTCKQQMHNLKPSMQCHHRTTARKHAQSSPERGTVDKQQSACQPTVRSQTFYTFSSRILLWCVHADPQCSEDTMQTPMSMLHNSMFKRQRTLELYLVISSDILLWSRPLLSENVQIQ